jgi:long-chain acyl-CoA synthetase
VTDVAASLSGKHLVVTGFTGFLAKVYVALLLEHVPDIGRITLLVRPRSKRQDALARVEKELDTSPVFRALRAHHGDALGTWLGARVDALDADVERPSCGLSPEALQALATADAVVHCAGLTDFQPDPLRALSVNVAGAVHVAGLARQLGVPLVHVSTCYVAGAVSGEVPESLEVGVSPSGVVFDPAAEVRALQLACRRGEARDSASARRDVAQARADRLGWVNIYTYTKGLAEHLVAGDGVTIVRPSIVECARTYPFPGWNEGLNTAGPLAWLISTAFRRLPAEPDHRFDVIPVDDVARGLATVTAATLEGRAGGVFQLASSDINPLTFGRCVELTGLGMRRWARKGGGTGLDQGLLRHLDPVPAPGRFDDVPRWRRWVSQARDGLAEREVPSWLDRMAGRTAHDARKAVLDRLDEGASSLKRIEGMLDLYKPFIADHDYCFRTDRIRALQAPEGPFRCDAEAIDWRHYWVDVEYPGLRHWCMPVLSGDKPPRDAASVPPFRLVASDEAALARVASK